MDKLIEALSILRNYDNPQSPTHCEHDVLGRLPGSDRRIMTDTEPSPLSARLFTLDGAVVHVPDVPLPPPASSGKLRVAIPYPADAPRATVWRAVVINQGNGSIMRASLSPAAVGPGDTLEVEFGEENVSYTGFVIPHPHPDPEAEAAAAWGARLEAALANLASLNEIVAEMTARVSGDTEFTAMVRGLLRDHSHALGFQFQDDGGAR